MFGSVVIFMLCYKERVMDTQLSVEASVGIGLGIGTLCGLVTMLVRSVGLFMVGLLLGLLVGVASLVVRDPNSTDKNKRTQQMHFRSNKLKLTLHAL